MSEHTLMLAIVACADCGQLAWPAARSAPVRLRPAAAALAGVRGHVRDGEELGRRSREGGRPVARVGHGRRAAPLDARRQQRARPLRAAQPLRTGGRRCARDVDAQGRTAQVAVPRLARYTVNCTVQVHRHTVCTVCSCTSILVHTRTYVIQYIVHILAVHYITCTYMYVLVLYM